uniref:Uncharacterized protein n=1 Tax=Helianthus annuus TaxID=4232 RepID=A0A251U804_HELAN
MGALAHMWLKIYIKNITHFTHISISSRPHISRPSLSVLECFYQRTPSCFLQIENWPSPATNRYN